jgi:hypothetical protein
MNPATVNPVVMLLALLPPAMVPYATAAFSIATTVITAASLICAVFPAPTTTSGAWYWIYTVVNKMAVNFGHAQSLSAPASTGIVGGATATTAPLIATSVVPLAVASPAQKAVTIVPDVLPTPMMSVTPAADVIAGVAAAVAFDAKKAAAAPLATFAAPTTPIAAPIA